MPYKVSRYFITTREINDKNDRIGFSTRSCKPLLLSQAVYSSLKDNAIDKVPITILDKLKELKYIVNQEEDELSEIFAEDNAYFEKNRNKLYTVIQLTGNCQLRCNYCGQTHTKAAINKEDTKLIIARIIHQIKLNNCKSLVVSWYGGEPLLALSKIKEITKELKEYCTENTINYEAKVSTNGLLLTPSTYCRLVNDLNLKQIEITLDGTKEYHDTTRKSGDGHGSFDKIFSNLLSIARLYKENEVVKNCVIKIRCNVNKYNESGISALIHLIAQNNLHKLVTLYVRGIYSWAQNGANKDSFELSRFAEKEIEWMKEMKELEFSINGIPSRVSGSCIATSPGTEMYDPFGNVYCCTETSLSKIYDNSIYHLGKLPNPNVNPIANDWHNFILKGTIPCRDCNILPICGGGCPKAWHEGNRPCPTSKYNIENRLLLAFSKLVEK